MSLILNGNTGISGVDGSAGTPALQGNDSNTGVSFGTDTVTINTGGVARVTTDASGNVGIGVTPSAWDAGYEVLQNRGGAFWSGSTATARLTQNTYFATSYKYVNTAAASMYAQVSGAHQWHIAPSGTAGNAISFTQAMTLSSSGTLSLGTTSGFQNAAINAVKSVAGLAGVARNIVNIENTGVNSTTKAENNILRIASNGTGADTSINLTDSVTYNYYFGGNNGGAYVMAGSAGVRLSNGGTSWASDSDERVKDIIEPITNAAQKVSTLRAVIGKYKTDPEDKRRAFLIAQDVQAVLPEAVFDEQGTLMLAYTEVIPLLVSAIQEQQAIIQSLTSRLEALENK